MRFDYTAYSLRRGVVKAHVEARDELEAKAFLESQGLKLMRLKASRSPFSMESLLPALFKVNARELIAFSRQMATMLSSGGNLLRTLEMLERESRGHVMRNTLAGIRKALDEGESLSAALAQHPKVFNPLFCSVVEVGEYTGRLAPALDQLADILEKEHEAKQKAIRTLMYPAAIIGLSAITLGVLMTVAMPPLLKVFEQMGTNIPLMTRIVVSAVGAVTSFYKQIILGGLAGLVSFVVLRRFPSVKYMFDAAMIRAPIIGPFMLAGELSRFARTVSMLLEAGVSLANAVQLGISGCKNQLLRRAFSDAQDSLISGHGLIEALKRCSLIPSMFLELVMLGEETNSLKRTMKDAADAYQKQLEQRLNSILGMLEPASTVVVGAIVGIIAFSMFVPIYSGLNVVK